MASHSLFKNIRYQDTKYKNCIMPYTCYIFLPLPFFSVFYFILFIFYLMLEETRSFTLTGQNFKMLFIILPYF